MFNMIQKVNFLGKLDSVLQFSCIFNLNFTPHSALQPADSQRFNREAVRI